MQRKSLLEYVQYSKYVHPFFLSFSTLGVPRKLGTHILTLNRRNIILFLKFFCGQLFSLSRVLTLLFVANLDVNLSTKHSSPFQLSKSNQKAFRWSTICTSNARNTTNKAEALIDIKTPHNSNAKIMIMLPVNLHEQPNSI